MKTTITVALATLMMTFYAADANAQVTAQSALSMFDHEPPVAETVIKCLEYFRVHPDDLDGLRASARNRALLPILSGGFRFDNLNFDRNEVQSMFQPRTNVEQTGQVNLSFTVGAVWNLSELAFNPSDIQAYGLVGIQRDLILEIVRSYYLRRQLSLRLHLQPPSDPLALAALQMRVDEFTAILDVLTNGWFTTEVDRRRGR